MLQVLSPYTLPTDIACILHISWRPAYGVGKHAHQLDQRFPSATCHLTDSGSSQTKLLATCDWNKQCFYPIHVPKEHLGTGY